MKKIHAIVSAIVAATGVTAIAAPSMVNAATTNVVYTVKAGDGLNAIARKFGTTASAIAAANHISNINMIYVGQRLTIPGATSTTPTKPSIPTVPSTPKPAPGAGKVLYLTFDDGPDPTYTPKVLAILNRYGAKGTFFSIGKYVDAYPSLSKSVVNSGNVVQSHSYKHDNLTRLSWSSVKNDALKTKNSIQRATGVTPTLERPPYGAYNTNVVSALNSAGLGKQTWNIDTEDWTRPGTSAIISRAMAVTSKPAGKGIILFHEGGGDRSQTMAALPTIITRLKAQGYTFGVLRTPVNPW